MTCSSTLHTRVGDVFDDFVIVSRSVRNWSVRIFWKSVASIRIDYVFWKPVSNFNSIWKYRKIKTANLRFIFEMSKHLGVCWSFKTVARGMWRNAQAALNSSSVQIKWKFQWQLSANGIWNWIAMQMWCHEKSSPGTKLKLPTNTIVFMIFAIRRTCAAFHSAHSIDFYVWYRVI